MIKKRTEEVEFELHVLRPVNLATWEDYKRHTSTRTYLSRLEDLFDATAFD